MNKAGLATSTNAVAAFVAEHLGHRAQARKKAIELALSLVSSGIFEPAPMSGRSFDPCGMGTPISKPGSPNARAAGTQVGIGPVPQADGHPVASVKQGPLIAALSLNTEMLPGSATLGASSVSHVVMPALPMARGASRPILVGGASLALIGLVLGFVALRHPSAASSAAASPAGNEEALVPVMASSTGAIAARPPSPQPPEITGVAFQATGTASPEVMATHAPSSATPRPSASVLQGAGATVTPVTTPKTSTKTTPTRTKPDDDGF